MLHDVGALESSQVGTKWFCFAWWHQMWLENPRPPVMKYVNGKSTILLHDFPIENAVYGDLPATFDYRRFIIGKNIERLLVDFPRLPLQPSCLPVAGAPRDFSQSCGRTGGDIGLKKSV